MTGPRELDVVDRLAIEDLIVAYARAMDTQDWTLLHSLFTPDAITTMDRVGDFGSRDELVDFYAERFTIFAVLQHFVSNFVIQRSGDKGNARNHFVSHHVPKEGAPYTYGGTFDFDLVRAADGWQITAHTIRILWEAGSPRPVQRG
jgi:3-phenylpropionate/cinnamic acid dioxygenase small subunit